MKNKNGFTLIELMVVVGIISLFSLLVFTNYREGEKQLALQRSAHQLAQDIRRAQAMAMSAAACEPCGNIVPSHYGIYIESPFNDAGNHTYPISYILFADISNNTDEGYGCFDAMGPPSGDVVIEDNILFESGIYLKDVGWNLGCENRNNEHRKTHLAFSPPDPKNSPQIGTCKHPTHGTVECSEITLILGAENLNKTIAIRINKAGLIEIIE